MALDNENLIFNLDKDFNTFNLSAKQFDTDNARSFTFQLIQNNSFFDLTGTSVKVGGIKADGKNIFNDVKIINANNGIIELDLTSQMLAVDGVLKLEFIFMKGDVRLSSYPFEIKIIPSVTNFMAVESSDEFVALTNALNSVNEAIKNTEPQMLAKNIMDNTISYINITFNDCNNFTSPNKYLKWDTGQGEFKHTPLGDLSKNSGVVFEIINFGSQGRIQQEFRQTYPPDKSKIWIRNFATENNNWSNWSSVYTSADVSQDADANKIVQRNSDGDISARLLRTNYPDENSMIGAIAFRVNNNSDNYTRYCSNPGAVRGWLETISKNGDTITGRLEVGDGSKFIDIGAGSDDVAIQNTKSGKWLQLKDDGRLCYSDKQIYTQDNFINRLGLNGYQYFPNGLILQWGYMSNLSSKDLNTVNLPIALQDNNYVAIATMANGANSNPNVKIVNLKRDSFRLQAYADGLDACWFVAGSI